MRPISHDLEHCDAHRTWVHRRGQYCFIIGSRQRSGDKPMLLPLNPSRRAPGTQLRTIKFGVFISAYTGSGGLSGCLSTIGFSTQYDTHITTRTLFALNV